MTNTFLRVLPFVACMAWLPCTSIALIMTGKGNDPVNDAGWPAGALAVANLKSRIGWWEGPPFGGGNWNFQYRGDTASFTEALAAFAAIRTPVLELVIHDDSGESPFLKDEAKADADTQYDWSFSVWVPANWHRLYNNPKSFFGADQPQFRQPVDPPRLDLHLRAGGVDFSKIKIPPNIRVKDERASAVGLKVEGGAMVRAEFFDMATGKPISGAHLIVARLPEGKANKADAYDTIADTVSDADGRALAEKISAGNVRISVTAAGYAPRLLGYDQLGERSFRTYSVSLAKASSQSGIVVDADGKPVKGVQVRADSLIALDGRGYPPPDSPNPRSTLTDETGRFTLAGLPAGHATLNARADGYYFGDIFTLHEIPAPAEIRLKVSRACKVHVAVTDKAGKPLSTFENATVMVEIHPKDGAGIGKWSGSGNVAPDGTIDFTGMPAGEYRLTTRPNPGSTARDYASEKLVTLTPGANVTVTMAYR